MDEQAADSWSHNPGNSLAQLQARVRRNEVAWPHEGRQESSSGSVKVQGTDAEEEAHDLQEFHGERSQDGRQGNG